MSATATRDYTQFGFNRDDRIYFDRRHWCLKTRSAERETEEETALWEAGYIIETVDGKSERRVEALTFQDIDKLFSARKIDCERGYFSGRNAIDRRMRSPKIFDLPAATILRARMVSEFLELELDRYDTGEFFTRSDAGYAKFIKAFKAENEYLITPKTGKREVIPGPRQFGRLVERFEDNLFEPGSLLPRHRGGVGQKSRFTPEEVKFHADHAKKYQSKDRPTKLDCYVQMAEANENRKAVGEQEYQVPSLRTFQRLIDDLGDYRNELTRAGDPSRVTRKFGMSRNGYQPQRPLEYIEMDEHKLDVIRLLVKNGIWEYLHPDVQRRIEEKIGATNDGRVWLSVALDAYSRSVCGAKLLWSAPDGASAVATLAMVARSKDYETKLYGTMTKWPQGGTAEYIHVDAGASYTSLEFQQAAYSYTGHVAVTPSKHPHLRGRVERFFRTINQRYIHLLSGQTFSNVLLRDRYDAQKYRHMTDDQLAEFLVMLIVDCYHNTKHRGLYGLTPLQAWYFGTQNANGTVRGYPGEREYAEAFSVVSRYKVGTDGIKILGLPYSNLWLQQQRERRYDLEVVVRFNEIDVSRIQVKDPFSDDWMEVPCILDGLKGWRVFDWLEQLKHMRRKFGPSAKISAKVAQAALAGARAFANASKSAAGIGSPITTRSMLDYWDEQMVGSFTIAREAATDYGDLEAFEAFDTSPRPDPFAPSPRHTEAGQNAGPDDDDDVHTGPAGAGDHGPPSSASKPRAVPLPKPSSATMQQVDEPLPQRARSIRVEKIRKDDK